ncbi:MAG: helix-turn-helix transcriptional regulator [Pirellulaceae bacterium]|jgi:hypothetical protein|nr:helix-turn-helix transcriptional regulator [Pirellulaceae bacterium]
MRYSFRLAELLGHVPDPRKRPGTIKAIVDYTGLDRHQVAALLKNEVKYIPMHALSRLCDYLIENGHASGDQLPGALFAVEPEHFWELLARRRRLEMCLGVRRGEEDEWPEGAWVVASDSVLLGELLNGVSTLGGTAMYVQRGKEGGSSHASQLVPHPEHLKQSLVWSPGQMPRDVVVTRAREVYDAFSSAGSDQALICVGSMKSNPVAELVLANAFGCDPFVAVDDVPQPHHRACPFFLRYRVDDPHPPSCAGGTRLSQDDKSSAPGIYFEDKGHVWRYCGWDKPEHDTAFVFYMHRESQGRLEMVLGGFSGRATRLLAKTLSSGAEGFWPPIYSRHGIQVGAFIVKYTFSSEEAHQPDLLQTDLIAGTTIIPLEQQVIARRLEATAAGERL